MYDSFYFEYFFFMLIHSSSFSRKSSSMFFSCFLIDYFSIKFDDETEPLLWLKTVCWMLKLFNYFSYFYTAELYFLFALYKLLYNCLLKDFSISNWSNILFSSFVYLTYLSSTYISNYSFFFYISYFML